MLQSQPCWKVRPSQACLWWSWSRLGSMRVQTLGLQALRMGPAWQLSWGSWELCTLHWCDRSFPPPCLNRLSASSHTCSLPVHLTACCCAKTCAAGTVACWSGQQLLMRTIHKKLKFYNICSALFTAPIFKQFNKLFYFSIFYFVSHFFPGITWVCWRSGWEAVGCRQGELQPHWSLSFRLHSSYKWARS